MSCLSNAQQKRENSLRVEICSWTQYKEILWYAKLEHLGIAALKYVDHMKTKCYFVCINIMLLILIKEKCN